MKNQDFTIAFTVDRSPAEVYKAVNNVRGWWGEGLEGASDKLGAEFTYQHEDVHRTTQKVTRLVPGKKVVWRVTESQLNFVEDPTEWKGTEVVFDITRKGGRTELRMTHVGLQPRIECYDGCSKGWTYYFTESLKRLIETGKGRPDPKEKGVPQKASARDESFTVTIAVDQSPQEVFAAAGNPRGWWSEEIEGRTDKLGGVFTYHYQDVHRSKMKVTEFVPGKKLVWTVLDNHFNFIEDETEWKGTRVLFEISRKGDKTELKFTHEGLVPQYECFKVCRDAWGSYIKGSLRDLITTGKGKPNPKEREGRKK